MSSTFREVFRFELAYQGRRVWYWLIFAALLMVAYMLARDSTLAEALREDFFANSPFAIAKVTVVGGLLWLVTAGAVAGEAAARDVSTGMHPLVYTAPVMKAEYLGGRFLAALLLNAVLLLTLQVGTLLALYAPGIDPAALGPFRPAAFLTNYLFLSLPNAFFVTALQFLLASRSGRPMSAYVASFALVFFGVFVAALLLFNRGAGKLLDPIGIRFVLDDMSHEWTSWEKSWRLVGLDGVVLQNRLVWLAIGLAALALAYASFRFAHRAETVRWWRRSRWRKRAPTRPAPSAGATGPATGPSVEVPRAERVFGFATQARQTLAIAWRSTRTMASTWPGRAFLFGLPLLTILLVADQMSRFTERHIPTTALILRELTGPLSDELSRWAFVPFLIVFFAGELVWRERDAGLGEITDAMPGSAWVPFLGKTLGLGVLLALFSLLTMAAGMAAQAILGHREFEVGLYATALLGLQLPEYLLFVPLAVAAHTLANQKYAGHLLGILAYAVIALAPMFGLEHPLLIYGASPWWSYTAMRGFGPSLEPWLWFKLYWAGWALLLAVAARLLWVRGLETGLRERIAEARRRLTHATVGIAVLAAGMVLTFGGFVFYNTNVLHDYRGSEGIAELQADYERRYRRYADAPQPALSAASLRVDLFPERGEADIRGAYRLVNHTAGSIDTLHVSLVHGQEDTPVSFDRPATLVHAAEGGLPHRIYALEAPLRPGEALRMEFRARIARRGFSAGGADPSVSEHASFFTVSEWLPQIGYQARRELTSPAERRRLGLPARPLIPALEEADTRPRPREGIAFQAVVGTAADQVAVAPGALERSWTEDGRRYFHFVTDGPIGDEWVVASAGYAVREERWEDPADPTRRVAIRIYHHPEHASGIDRIVHGIRASLDYMTREYGPYRYGHLTFVERPGNGTGMHADPGMISFLEGAALLSPDYDPERFDLPFAVVAHEMGHQWHPPVAFAEGAPVLTEGVASYYALRVVEDTYGAQVHRQLRFMRLPYPYRPIRRGEPLLRGVDPYMAYRRGPFALRAVEKYVGGDEVNTALRRVLEKHRAPDAPLATMLDLYRELRAVTPDSTLPLLRDLFEANTFWELKTERVTAEKTAEGTWRVTIPVQAHKIVVDERGEETEVRLDEWVEIGAFGAPERRSEKLGNPLYAERHRLRSGDQTITVTVDERPVLAGVDPYHVLDWEEKEDDDNLEEMRYVGGTGEG
jgi:ABC-2 type transport system permease protein